MAGITQNQMEASEAILGGVLIANLKEYIKLFVADEANLQNVDIAGLAEQVTQITNVIDGDPDSEGYQAFRGLLDDVTALKGDNTSNQSRLTAVESALNAMDTAWRAEIARVESESKSRDTALGQRIDGIEGQIAQYAASRLEKDTEHDGRLATLEAFKTNITGLLQDEINRAIAKEAELQAGIQANTDEINAIKQREADYATRDNVNSGFAAFTQGGIDKLWEGRDVPSGLPTVGGDVTP